MDHDMVTLLELFHLDKALGGDPRPIRGLVHLYPGEQCRPQLDEPLQVHVDEAIVR